MAYSEYESALDGYLNALRRQCIRRCFFGVIELEIESSIEETIGNYVSEMKRRYAAMGEEYNYLGKENITYKMSSKIFDEYLYQYLQIQEANYFKLIEHDISDYLMFASEAQETGSGHILLQNDIIKLTTRCNKYENECVLVFPLVKTAIFFSFSICVK